MNRQQFAGLLGFAFTAMWVARDLSDAALCLIGAAVFWAIDAQLRGQLNLRGSGEDWQQRGPRRR